MTDERVHVVAERGRPMMFGNWQPDPIALVTGNPCDEQFVRDALLAARIANPLLACSSGEELQRLLALIHPVWPAVVVTDIELGGSISGLDLVRWMRRRPDPVGSTPIMVLTGTVDPGAHLEARALGARSYLEKPVTSAHFLEALQSIGYLVTTGLVSNGTGFRIIQRPV